MNYLVAMRRIIDIQKLYAGGFLEKLEGKLDGDIGDDSLVIRPESFSILIESISANSELHQNSTEILIERARQMKTLMDADRIHFSEIIIFNMEFDLVRLLLMIFVCGMANEEVPITEQDIERIDSVVGNYITAGFQEEGENVFGVISNLFNRLRQIHQLPEFVTELLPA